MPNGPQGQKRPADAVARAVMVAQVATGEANSNVSPVYRPHIDRAEGEARSVFLSEGRKKEIAKAGAAARWS